MTAGGSRRRTRTLGGGLVFLNLFGCTLLFLPTLDRHRIGKYEAQAVGHILSVAEKQKEFKAAHNGSFADSFAQLPDVTLSGHTYTYSLEVTARDERGRVAKYIATASPSEPGKTGTRYFSIDETGILRYETMRPVDPQSPVLRRY
jgi:hypothetical protein